MKKFLAMVLMVTMLMTMAAGLSFAESEKTTVVFWNSWTGGDGDTLVALVNKFNEENDHIYIDMTRTTSFSNMLQTALPTGEAADLILSGTGAMDTYDGYLRPIDDIWDNTSLKKEDFSPTYLDPCYHSTDGKLYCIPFQISTYMQYYNKDLFTAAGLDPECPPKTFTEWTDYAAKITALSTEENPVYGSGLFYCYNGQNMSVLQHFSGYLVDEVDGEMVANVVGNEGLYEGLKWMKDLYVKGYNPLEKDIDSMMAAGQIGIMTNGGWLKGTLDASGVNYGIAPLPVVEGDDIGNWAIGGTSCFIITTSATDETAKAAEEFIEWWIATGTGLEASELTGGVDYSNVTPNAEWSLSMFYLNAYLPCVNSPEYQAIPVLVDLTPGPEAVTSMYVPAGNLTSSACGTAVDGFTQELIFNYPDEITDEDLDALLEPYQADLEDAIFEYYE